MSTRLGKQALVAGAGIAGLAAARVLATSAIPDFIDTRTEGQRRADLMDTLRFLGALLKVAAPEPAVHRLFIEVPSLLKPRGALRTPEPTQGIQAAIAGSETPVTRATPCPN